MRIGHGYDVHRLVEERPLILGGVIAGAFLGVAGVVKESVSIFTPAQGGLTSLSTVFQPLAAVLLAQLRTTKALKYTKYSRGFAA